jgi:hypothetical protein
MVPTVVANPRSSSNELFDQLSRFRRLWPGRGWSWDGRFSCVASSFALDLEQDARSAVGQAFTAQYTQRTVVNAPPHVYDVAEATGGLRSDQLLVATPESSGLVAYGLWWPWGDDVTISFRVGLAGPMAYRHEESLRELFGASY